MALLPERRVERHAKGGFREFFKRLLDFLARPEVDDDETPASFKKIADGKDTTGGGY